MTDSEITKIEICKKIQTNVATLNTTELEEIFKIIYNGECKYTKNNNGLFVNLNWIDIGIINKINDYIEFCISSREEIKRHELLRKTMELEKTKKGGCPVITEKKPQTTKPIAHNRSECSSSMRFYLLKKKFMKLSNTESNTVDNVLEKEPYLIIKHKK
jgi:hypothetical protein